MKDPPKPESQEPPAAAAVSETAPGDAVDTFKVSNKAKRRMRKMRNSLKMQEAAGQETQMQEVSETLETDTSIEHLCELLGGLHLSSEPSAPATPSPVLELHHLVANSSGPFNRLKPLRPATFIFEFSPTFGFGPTQETDSQMSGPDVSMETPEIEEPRETPSPSEGQGAALEPLDHVRDVSSASPRASKAVKKTKRRMTKTKKTDLPQRQEETDPRETDAVEPLRELLDGLHLPSKPFATATPSPVPQLHRVTPFNSLRPLQPAKFIFKSSSAEIKHFCPRVEDLHISSKPPATPSPVPELHHIGANSSTPFNRLKPLRPATFIYESPISEMEHLCQRLDDLHLSPTPPATPSSIPELHRLVEKSSGPFNKQRPLQPATFIYESPISEMEHLCQRLDDLHLSPKPPAWATPSSVPELHHLVANSSGPFNSLKPLRPATFFFELSPTFGFGQKLNSDSQMSGQEGSMERPETADPTATPSPSEGQGAALEPLDHVRDGSSTSRRVSKAAKKVKMMRKTKNSDVSKRQEMKDTRETDTVKVFTVTVFVIVFILVLFSFIYFF
ncbi:putative protein FAM47C [Triplophysa rosa]|uniref:putative protein FAM47C n=1 Tax=Triplophysa rosa TaxID=992332 RepID=UPI002546110B|nr:putative protein FAM47C [Triplophysa rosa]